MKTKTKLTMMAAALVALAGVSVAFEDDFWHYVGGTTHAIVADHMILTGIQEVRIDGNPVEDYRYSSVWKENEWRDVRTLCREQFATDRFGNKVSGLWKAHGHTQWRSPGGQWQLDTTGWYRNFCEADSFGAILTHRSDGLYFVHPGTYGAIWEYDLDYDCSPWGDTPEWLETIAFRDCFWYEATHVFCADQVTLDVAVIHEMDWANGVPLTVWAPVMGDQNTGGNSTPGENSDVGFHLRSYSEWQMLQFGRHGWPLDFDFKTDN